VLNDASDLATSEVDLVMELAQNQVRALNAAGNAKDLFTPEQSAHFIESLHAVAAADGVVSPEEVCTRAPRLELVDGEDQYIDHALVDLAIIDAVDTAARAVWEPQRIRELYLTQARVDCIGMAAIGAQVEPLEPFSGRACRLVLGAQGRRITAPIAPGLMADLRVSDYQQFDETECPPVALYPGVVALDGEREHVLSENVQYRVRYNPMGPLVVDVDSCLQLAADRGYLRDAE
jgi:hypothetical protein